MKYFIKSEQGRIRNENQDKAAVFENNGVVLAVLCDGMGGHKGGSHASGITVATFEKEFMRASGLNRDNINKWFTDTISQAIKGMAKRAENDIKLLDMGTTVTAVVIFSKTDVVIFNIGDSRTYAFAGKLTQITRDHNLRNYYIDKHNYTEDEASQLLGAAALTSALGPKKTAKPEAFSVDEEVKYYILTSDGVHDYIAKPVFEQILREPSTDLEQKIDEIIFKAEKGKSSDNLSVIIVDLGE